MRLPRLRTDIEMFPVTVEGKQLIGLRDPHGYNHGVLLISVGALDILRFLDGEHSMVDVQAEWMRHKGEMLFSDDVQRLIDQLDQHFLLDTPRFLAHKNAVQEQFVNAPVRPAAHAGGSYPDDPARLREYLNQLFTAEEGAGWPQRFGASNDLKGIIAPHIDLRVGGPCYSWAYRELAERSQAQTYIILGTSHYGLGDLFVPTRKDFVTPLGVMKTDQAFLTLLEDHYGGPISQNELAHRTEHSIEFQVVFLQHVLADRRPVQIVPILVTSFHQMLLSYQSPYEDASFAKFINALKQAIREYERPTCFIIGADLAHVGHKFGDPFAAQERLAQIEQQDLTMLRTAEAVDPIAFFQVIRQDGDQHKVCGFPPICTFLAATEATSGTLLKYEQWSEESTRSAVTYASMAFY
ncbi:MAG: AmmeMemoRadiSam system protein B [Acidobacteriota bacterium]|nr:AmmeMemoRadiSam system protein B [Blastocatellia bacterium]MDW8238128.1 AmmeMemoRadiSam system protein B [Acidobacteriota bacterium]